MANLCIIPFDRKRGTVKRCNFANHCFGSALTAWKSLVFGFACFFLLLSARVLAQTSFGFVNNITVVPVPGVGHDYLHDLDEIVNPANGSVSVRIEAPRPKERGLNYPFYSFMYDSTQQFAVSYQLQSASAYNCGPDTVNDGVNGQPPQPLTCVVPPLSFPYESISYPAGTNGVLPGPNSMLAINAEYSRELGDGSDFQTCYLYGPYAYEDPYGVIHNLGAYSIGEQVNGGCGALGISSSPVGGDEQYKIVVPDNLLALQWPNYGTLLASGYGGLIDTHGDAVKVAADGPAASLPMEDTNGNAVNGTGRTGSYQSFQPWGDAFAKTASRTFAGGATYNYTWGTASSSFSPTSVDESVIEYGYDNLCVAPKNYGGTTNPVLTQMQNPDELYYKFSYDPSYGLLNKITYPTGAWVEYTWGVNSLSDASGFGYPAASVNSYNDPIHYSAGQSMNTSCMFEHDTPAIVTRVVSYDGVHSAQEQDFSYSTNWGNQGEFGLWVSKQTTVTTKDLLTSGTPSFKTIYNYSPWPVYVSLGSNLKSSPIAVESSIVYYDTNGSILRTVTKAWNSYIQLAGECTTLPNGKTSGTFYQYETYPIPGGFAVASNPSATTTNLPTDVAEYDYGLVTTPCKKPAGTPTKETVTTYANFANTPLWPTLTYTEGTTQYSLSMPPMVDRPATIIKYQNGTKVSETDYGYDQTAAASVSSPIGHDETNYGIHSTASRGNATTITKKCFQGSTTCTNSVTTVTHDTTGQAVSVTDANNNLTQLSYTDNYTSDDGSPAGNTNTYLTKITRPSTNGISHIESFQWDFNKGQLRMLTDENSNQTHYQYADPWWRLTQATLPDTGSITHLYDDSGPNPSVTTTALITSSLSLTSTTIMDGFGHVIHTQLNSDPDGVDYVDKVYDGLGRVASVSNPYRSTSDSTYGLTTFSYDSLDRETVQVQPDGSKLQWCYNDVASSSQTNCATNVSSQSNAEWVDFSDEVGNHLQRTYDAFARLTAVMEPNGVTQSPTMETDYGYDGLDDLSTVVQNGNNPANARSRSFIYDSLGRLTSAQNPESGTITYSYDPNGNVVTRVEPKANTTNAAVTTSTYSYDALNRLLSTVHADPINANSFYGYDGTAISSCPGPIPPTITSPTNLIDHRSGMCTSRSASSWSYDQMGRPLLEARANIGPPITTLNVGYTYYKNGSLNTLTYPSGDALTYVVGGAGRPTQVTDSSNNYATAATYAPQGALASMINGSESGSGAIITNNVYNDRLQPILLSAQIGCLVRNPPIYCQPPSPFFSLCYDFHLHVAVSSSPCAFNANTTGDNGNVFQVINNVDSTRSTVFTYDALNRISQANTINTTSANCWGEVYTIDAWGNLTNRAAPSGMSGSCFTEGLSATATTQNQLNGIGVLYDGAGNVTNDGLGNTPTYDAENRIVTDQGVTYYYDSDGFRMEKSPGTMYWPGPGGEVLTEANLAGVINEEYIYFNGERIARVDRPSGTVNYYFSDNLGSASVITGSSGTVQEQYFYLPYGWTQSSTGSDPNHYKFTGKERDAESNLDYFGARFYGPRTGRFMTPDWAAKPTSVPYASFGNPQSLNLYSYVNNNPTTTRDPDGHVGPVTGIDIAVEIATYIAAHPEEVQEAVAEAEAEAVAGAGASRWGLLAGPALFLGEMISPHTTVGGDKTQGQIEQEQMAEREPQTSGAGAMQGGGGLRYDNPGIHDPTSPKFVPRKTPLPSDAEAVFGSAIEVTGRASGTGQLSYGINDKGQFYRYSGQNGVLHYSGTIASRKVPTNIRKQLQDALKQRQRQ